MNSNTFHIPTDVQPYIKEMRVLIRYGYLKPDLPDDSRLLTLPGVVDSRWPRAGASGRDLFNTLLEDVVKNELSGNDRLTAAMLFGVGKYAGLPQRERYLQAASLRGYDSWDYYRKEPLDRDLYLIFIRLSRRLEHETIKDNPPFITPTGAPAEFSLAEQFETTCYDAQHVFPEHDTDPWRVLTTRELISKVDGASSWSYAGHIWGRKNAEMAPRHILLGAGELDVIYDQPSKLSTKRRHYVTRLTFDAPLQRNESRTFSILREWPVVASDLTVSGRIDEASLTDIAFPISQATIGVRFPKSQTPASVWHFAALPNWMGSGVPDETNRLAVGSDGYVSQSWHQLLPGRSYGIAWEW